MRVSHAGSFPTLPVHQQVLIVVLMPFALFGIAVAVLFREMDRAVGWIAQKMLK